MTIQRAYLFKRFERFWHWSQAALVFTLLASGLRIHGVYGGLHFLTALRLHLYAAWAVSALWVFAIFWHFTTGEWKQYIPTLEKIGAVARHYAWGMFLGERHPHHPTPAHKQNALQRLAYLWLKLMINPLLWGSGILLLLATYNWLPAARWAAPGQGIALAAWAHTAGAYLMLVFVIVHVYLATTGVTPLAHIEAMITGWEASEE